MLMPFLVFCAAQADATALDQLLVIEKARPLALTRTQLQDFSALAKRIAEAHDEARQRLAALREQEAKTAPLIEAMLAGKVLTPEESALLASAKTERVKVANTERAAVDKNIATAVSKLTPEQKLGVIDARATKRMEDLAGKVFTATPKEWPEVRHYAAAVIANEESMRILNEASQAWERKTGKRFDDVGGPTHEDLGIKDDLGEVRKGAEAYVDQARSGKGASKDELRRKLVAGNYRNYASSPKLEETVRFILDSKGSIAALEAMRKASE